MPSTPQHPRPTLILAPLRAGVPAEGGTLEVLVRIQAPDRPEAGAAERQRPPLRLALVIDRSGSMSGQPLDEALLCAEYIAGGLQARDQVAVVLYDDQVQTPVPLGAGGDAAAIRAALAHVESGGSTALFDGWQAGARSLEGGVDGAISRVLLLSDGQANHGLVDADRIQQHCENWAARGVTTTTVGLGRDFNEDLMIGMARAGGGQHYYGQTAEDLHDGFDEELSLLQSLLLRKLRLKLVPGAGVVAEPLGLIRREAGSVCALPDLAWGAEAWLLVRLFIAADATSDPSQPKALFAVSLEAESADGGSHIQASQVLALPVVPATEVASLPQDALVARRLKELEFAAATARIQALAATGEFRKAQGLLKSLEADVADHPWLGEKLTRLQSLAADDAAMAIKEIKFSMFRAASRLVAKSETEYLGSETDSRVVPAFLRRKASEGKGRKKE